MVVVRLILAILALAIVALAVVWLVRYLGEGTGFENFVSSLWYLPIAIFIGVIWGIFRTYAETDGIWDTLKERGLQRLQPESTKAEPPFLIGGVRIRGKLLGPQTLSADKDGIILLSFGRPHSRLNWGGMSALEIHSKVGGGCFARIVFDDVGPRGTKEIKILWDERLTKFVPAEIRRRVNAATRVE